MSLIMPLIFFAAGIALVVKGGDIFVDAARWMSDVTGISKVVIGATVVSFATTSPEYSVSTIAILKGYNDLSIGNAVGSLICNLGIGFAILVFFMPGKIRDPLCAVKGILMIVSAFALWVSCLNGFLSVAEGILLLLIFALFTFINIRYAKDDDKNYKVMATNKADITKNVSKFVIGAAAIVFGSNIIVDYGRIIALALGVSDAVIGLTVIAVGTSLPELVTAITAVLKKESSLSVGNIIGANTLDATLILATGAFISGGELSVSQETVRVDLPVAILLMAIAVLPIGLRKRVYRWQGAALGLVYGVYLFYLVALRGI